MSLRQKLLLPLFISCALILGYLYGVWVPHSLQTANAERQQLVERHLDSVAEGLVPLLLGNQLDIVYENLTALLDKNKDWTSIVLQDAKGRQLFPLAGTPLPPARNGNEYTIERPISYLNIDLGKLIVRVDMTPSIEQARSRYFQLALMLVGVLGIIVLITTATLEIVVRRPVRQLSEAAHGLARQDFEAPLPQTSADEVGTLVDSFASMRDELRLYHDELLNEINERKEAEEALTELNTTLEQRVQEEVAKNRDKDHILIQQSRLAAMGEMVHNIAHQWRQPLNSLMLLISNVQDDFRFKTMTEDSLQHDVTTARRLIDRMSSTIDDFRDFFRPDREAADFDVAQTVSEAVFIVDATLKNNRIQLSQELAKGLTATGFPNQFAQSVLNVLMNAKEAIVNRQVEEGHIQLRLTREKDDAVLAVEDNGGGIPGDVLPKIFDPYFTTKEQGSGIGLYMVKTIVEKNMGGHVEAANTDKGARFTLRIPLTSNKAAS